MKGFRPGFTAFCLMACAIPASALAKPVYLICQSTDPKWPSPVEIVVDEDRGSVSVANANSSGRSPNPVFKQDSLDFGYDGSLFHVDRITLKFRIMTYAPQWHEGVCKVGTPAKRAF